MTTDQSARQIDRTAPTPYYQQLAEILQHQIETGDFADDDRLPSESELCRRYDLSRSTVRQTLRSLQDNRLIRMIPRRGAFVNRLGAEGWRLQVTSGFLEVSAEQGAVAIETRVLRAGIEILPPDVCHKLDLPRGAKGFVLERLRARNGEMVMHSTNYLDEALGHELVGRPVLSGKASLNQTLQSLGVVITMARRDVTAVGAPEEVARHLDCAPGHPLALVESVSLRENGRPFDCYWSYVHTGRLKISVTAATPEAL